MRPPVAAAEQELLRHDFPILDALRAVGALCVLTTHAAFWAGAYTSQGTWGTVLARLDVGVALFFVLSGFLLSRPYLARAAAAHAPPGTARYLWKRVLRILPIYVITVLIALTFIEQQEPLRAVDWLVTLTMTDTFVDTSLPSGLTQMWSLAVEVSFYLVLPGLMLLATGRRRLRPGRTVLVVVAMVALSVFWHLSGVPMIEESVSGAPSQWLPAYTSWFAVGILLALAHELRQRGAWAWLTDPLVAMARQPGSCWAIVAGLMLVLATPIAGPSMLAPPTTGEALTKNLLYAVIGGLVVVTGIFEDRSSGYARVLSRPRARHVGFISYSVFCLHLPILHLIMWSTGWNLFEGRFPQIWLLTLVLSLVASELSYRVVEAPAMRLKGLGSGRRETAQPSAAAKGTSIR